jgi:DegV family protein with EDD domain
LEVIEVSKVRVVTDSTADLDAATAESLGVEVLPIYVRWGRKSYRDGLDLSPSQFYRRLAMNSSHPTTSQPSPDDFVQAYSSLREADGIVSVHISSKISGTYNSARLAVDIFGGTPPVEVIDSGLNSAGLALVVLSAARIAAAGGTFAEVVAEAKQACTETRMVALFDTMKYLARGGRISPAIAVAAGFLRVKPVLTFREGEIIRAGLVRSREEGMTRLLRFVQMLGTLREVIVSHSTTQEELEVFLGRLEASYPGKVSRVFDMGAALGVHGGPGMIVVAARRM